MDLKTRVVVSECSEFVTKGLRVHNHVFPRSRQITHLELSLDSTKECGVQSIVTL